MNQRSLSLALTYLLTNIPSSTPFSIPRHQHVTAIKTTTSFPPFISSPSSLFGIMDEVNSDAFQLGKTPPSSPSTADLSKAYEIFLAELVFSPNDPRVDIIDNAELAFDPLFIAWLDNKVKNCTDPEEKLALRDLHDMILDTQEKIKLGQAAAERQAKEEAEAEARRIAAAEAAQKEGEGLSDADVLRRASLVDNAAVEKEREDIAAKQGKKQTFYESVITPEIRASYDKLLRKLLPPYSPGESPASVVYNNYEQFDAQLVKVLNERRDAGDADVAVLLDALAVEQQKRVGEAMEKLQSILKLADPMRMEGAIVKMAKENRIDEAFLLLLEANADQAAKAGASGPAALMRRLRSRALDEKDKQASSKEIRLLRKLLRAETTQEREDLLTEAFTPKDALIVPGTMENAKKAVDGDAPEQEKPMPDVPPPDFINACKAVLLNFGNLDDGKGDMASRIKQIASEAEVVATRIFGKGMTAKEQQDRMWKEETTSIFDLEMMEIEAERMGEKAPWATKDIEDEILPGFDADGRMTIGGN